MRCLGSLLYVDLHVNTVKQMGHLLHELLTNLALYYEGCSKSFQKSDVMFGWLDFIYDIILNGVIISST